MNVYSFCSEECFCRTTAPEIWEQTHGQIDVFVSGAGTGGTISGVGRKLKGLKSDLQIILADPQGSGLFHKVGFSLSTHPLPS